MWEVSDSSTSSTPSSFQDDDLLSKLRSIWKSNQNAPNTQTAIVSKQHQEIHQALLACDPECLLEFNTYTDPDLIEVDILLKSWQGMDLSEAPIAIEYNGPWHYPRNSTEAYGKDVLKQKLLGPCTSHLPIAYFNWILLSGPQMRASFLQMVIDNELAQKMKEWGNLDQLADPSDWSGEDSDGEEERLRSSEEQLEKVK